MSISITETQKALLGRTLLSFEDIHLSLPGAQLLFSAQNSTMMVHDNTDAIIVRNTINALEHFKDWLADDNSEMNCSFYIRLNELLAKEQALSVGSFRSGNVNIDCIPEDIPPVNEVDIARQIGLLEEVDKDNFLKVVPEVFCRLARMQPFWDGNKRSTCLLCNAALLRKRLGIFVIRDEKRSMEFSRHLHRYYTMQEETIFDYIGSALIENIN